MTDHPQKGCVQDHVTFRLWKISDIILELVQDEDTVARHRRQTYCQDMVE